MKGAKPADLPVSFLWTHADATGHSGLRETVYLTWASTDAVVAKTATSAVAIAVDAAQPLKNLRGGNGLRDGGNAPGAPSSTVRFGDFSSVSVDPTTSDCAFACPS